MSETHWRPASHHSAKPVRPDRAKMRNEVVVQDISVKGDRLWLQRVFACQPVPEVSPHRDAVRVDLGHQDRREVLQGGLGCGPGWEPALGDLRPTAAAVPDMVDLVSPRASTAR